jgi:sec-independent protein translocase protein TatA
MSPVHLAIVAIVALLVFGPKKLPELAKGLGEAVKEFKKTMNGEHEPEALPPAMATTATPEGSMPTAGVVAAPADAAAPASTSSGAGTTPHT